VTSRFLLAGVDGHHDVQRASPFYEKNDLPCLLRRIAEFFDDLAATEELLELGQAEVDQPQLLEHVEAVDVVEAFDIRA